MGGDLLCPKAIFSNITFEQFALDFCMNLPCPLKFLVAPIYVNFYVLQVVYIFWDVFLGMVLKLFLFRQRFENCNVREAMENNGNNILEFRNQVISYQNGLFLPRTCCPEFSEIIVNYCFCHKICSLKKIYFLNW